MQDEKIYRDNLRLRRLLKKAKLRQEASLEDIDYGLPAGLASRSSWNWPIPSGSPLIAMCFSAAPPESANHSSPVPWETPPPGPAIPCFTCRAPRLFETLQQSRGDGSHLKALARLSRAQLLIIDDFLLTPLSDWERQDLLEVIEDRYQAGATVITSQCPIGDWHPNIGDPTLADAICDRLLHNAYRIELRGDSLRHRSTGNNRNNELKEVVVTEGKLS